MGKKQTVRFWMRMEFVPRDAWIGVFSRNHRQIKYDIWICLIPCFPLHISWLRVADRRSLRTEERYEALMDMKQRRGRRW